MGPYWKVYSGKGIIRHKTESVIRKDTSVSFLCVFKSGGLWWGGGGGVGFQYKQRDSVKTSVFLHMRRLLCLETGDLSGSHCS